MGLLLERTCYDVAFTLGYLYADDVTLHTLELPWRGNARNESCVPEGVYQLERHQSQKSWIGRSWALVNPRIDVKHWPSENTTDKGRFAILFHVANYARQLDGCIGVGRDHGIMFDSQTGDHVMAVQSSSDAMARLREVMDRLEEKELHITQYHPKYP